MTVGFVGAAVLVVETIDGELLGAAELSGATVVGTRDVAAVAGVDVTGTNVVEVLVVVDVLVVGNVLVVVVVLVVVGALVETIVVGAGVERLTSHVSSCSHDVPSSLKRRAPTTPVANPSPSNEPDIQ